MSLFEELKRRNVFRVGIAYVITSWLILQLADIVLDNTPAPEWVMHVIMLLLVIGFPLALLFAWAFEMTPEGLKKEKDVDRSKSITGHTGRRLDFAIIAVLVMALGYFAWDKFLAEPNSESAPGAVISADGTVIPDNADTQGSSAEQIAEPTEPPEKSIAVLPFVNMSNDPDQEFFSDGISEELLNVLAKYPGVRVAARTSSFQFKGQNQDVGEIARLLKVRNILEGSVRKSGNKLRITAQLIQADTGYHLWSETYDRELDDVFAIQDEISAAIGEALRVELALGTDHSVTAPRVAESSNTAAYEAFLRGRHLVNQRGRSNMAQAAEELKRAVRLDNDFAPAHAWMAIAYTMMLDGPATYGDMSLAEVKERAAPHVERALELDPTLAEAYGAKALLAMNANDFSAAMEATERALELNPVYVDAMNWRQITASNYGNYAESRRIMEKMIEVDPLSIIGRLNFAPTLAQLDLEAGREMAQSIANQNAWAAYTALGNIEFASGKDLSKSIEWFMRAYGEDPHDEFSNRNLIRLLSILGEYEEARRISDGNLFLADIQKGDLESAIHTLRADHAADPENYAPMTDLADALHLAGRFEESQAYYLQLRELSPLKLVFDNQDLSTISTVRMAFAFQQMGEEAAAEAAIAAHREDLARREELGVHFFSDHLAEAMARTIEGDSEGALDSLRTAIDLGFRDRLFFREPAMQSMVQNPDFLALKAEVDQLLAIEHDQVLQLICNENPIPDIWQPMDETCMGVVREAST